MLWFVDDDGPGDGLDVLQLCQDGWVQMLVTVAEIEVECYGSGGYVIYCCHLALALVNAIAAYVDVV